MSLGSLVDSARPLDDSVWSRFFVSSGPSDWTGGWCIWPGDMSRASTLECADRLRRHSTSIACAPTHTISPLIDASPRARAFSNSTCTSPWSLDNRSHRRPCFVFSRVVVRPRCPVTSPSIETFRHVSSPLHQSAMVSLRSGSSFLLACFSYGTTLRAYVARGFFRPMPRLCSSNGCQLESHMLRRC